MKTILVSAVLAIFILGCVSPSATINESTLIPPVEVEEVPVPQLENEVLGQNVYYFGATQGYLATPTLPGDYPGVILIHEWWGLNDNIKMTAEELAAEGYMVLAVDLYNGQVATTSQEASALRTSIDQEKAIENMRAANLYLRDQLNVPTVGAWGWCFGGGQSLQLALSEDALLDATVIYYGSLTSDEAQLQSIEWPVLGIFGAEDGSIPVESVNAFEMGLENVGVEHEVYIYPGVGHAFANPSNPNHAPAETEDAWEKTLTFLNTHLKVSE